MKSNNVLNSDYERLKELERKQKERYKNQNERTKELYDRLSFTVPKGKKKLIEEKAKSYGVTLNSFVSKVLLESVVNNNIMEMIFGNNTESMPKTPQKPQAAKEPAQAVKSTPKDAKGENKTNSKPQNIRTEAEKMAELQTLIDAKRAEEAERKRLIEERKAQAEKERGEEFQSRANGILEDLKARKEQRRDEDEKKYKQLSDADIAELLQDAPFSEWLENIGFDNALEPLSEQIGLNNAEKVTAAAKEKKRQEGIDKADCPF